LYASRSKVKDGLLKACYGKGGAEWDARSCC
jgi:hypothetical protein